jgi:hypothetical protein
VWLVFTNPLRDGEVVNVTAEALNKMHEIDF